MTSDMGEMFNALHKRSKARREANRHSSPMLLTAHKVEFDSRNYGAHLIVRHDGKVVDFWPGTGKWKTRGLQRYGRGVFQLLKHLGVRISTDRGNAGNAP